MKNSFAYLGPKGTFTEAAFLQMPIAQGAELIPAESCDSGGIRIVGKAWRFDFRHKENCNSSACARAMC